MGRVTAAGAIAMAAGLALAAPASAGIPGPTVSLGSAGDFEYLKATFENVVSQAGAPATCDEGESATGGGGTISGNGANAALNASYPTSSQAGGWAAEGSTSASGGRTVTTYAICSPESHGFSNGTSPIGAAGEFDDVLTLTGSCVEGQTLYGAQGSGADVRILELRPAFDGTSWAANLQNFGDTSATGTQHWACEDAFDPTIRQSDVTTVKPGDAGKATARCRRSEAVIAGGVFSAKNGEPRRDTWATSTRPYDSKDKRKTPDDGWSVKVQNGRASGESKIASYALCQKK